MNKEHIKIIRETQRILDAINQNIPVFFNIAQYEKLGLTYSTKKWGTNPSGNKVVVGHKHHLTDKGKRTLNTMI